MTEYTEINLGEKPSFEWNGTEYSVEMAVKLDKEFIIMEAEHSHPTSLEMYDFTKLEPKSIRLYYDKQTEEPLYGLITYTVPYKVGNLARLCCGGYYPLYTHDNWNCLMPHMYQNSVCW